MISKQTAYDIWVCYSEIEKGQKLIANLEESIKQGEPLDLRDVFGRQRNLQLGVPSGENSQRLFDIAPALAVAVIKAHVANKQSELMAINELAMSQTAL